MWRNNSFDIMMSPYHVSNHVQQAYQLALAHPGLSVFTGASISLRLILWNLQKPWKGCHSWAVCYRDSDGVGPALYTALFASDQRITQGSDPGQRGEIWNKRVATWCWLNSKCCKPHCNMTVSIQNWTFDILLQSNVLFKCLSLIWTFFLHHCWVAVVSGACLESVN